MSRKARNKIINGVKKCTRCGEIKNTNNYHSNGRGMRGWCKECDRKIRRGRQQKWKDRKNKYKIRDPIKERARGRIRDAVRYNKIIKPKICPICAKEIETKHMQGHHYKGYEYPLDIKWMCRWCHSKEHAQ